MPTKRQKQNQKKKKKKRKKEQIQTPNPFFLEAEFGLPISLARDINTISTFPRTVKGLEIYFAEVNGSPVFFSKLSTDANLRTQGEQIKRDLEEQFTRDDNEQLNLPPQFRVALPPEMNDPAEAENMMRRVVSDLNKGQRPDNQFHILPNPIISRQEGGGVAMMTLEVRQGLPSPVPTNHPGKAIDYSAGLGRLGGLLLPANFEKAMKKGKFSKRSSEYREVLQAMKTYDQAINAYRQASRTDANADPTGVRNSFRQLKEAGEKYASLESKTASKRQTVLNMLAQLGDTEKNEGRIKQVRWGEANKTTVKTAQINPINPNTVQTASDVSVVTLSQNIGASNTKRGFMKKALPFDPNKPVKTTAVHNLLGKSESNDQLGALVLKEPANMLIRQVLSSRLAKAFGLNVISEEVFGRQENGDLVGISAKVDENNNSKQIMKQDAQTGDRIIQNIDLKNNGKVQKGLSDLQLMDAITGQFDRHFGNIFIDPITGEVKGIDNDGVFPKNELKPDGAQNMLVNQFVNKDGNPLSKAELANPKTEIFYTQTLIDRESGEKILRMSEDDFRALLRGREDDPQSLTGPEEQGTIELAVRRFEAVQKQVKTLKKAGELISASEWGPATYQRAMNADQSVGDDPKFLQFLNYNRQYVDLMTRANDPTDDLYKMAA